MCLLRSKVLAFRHNACARRPSTEDTSEHCSVSFSRPAAEIRSLTVERLINAGGYCHNLANGQKVVDFADDFTPDESMTWDNFAQAATVRSFCDRVCTCGPEKKSDNYGASGQVAIAVEVYAGIYQPFPGVGIGTTAKQGVNLFVESSEAGKPVTRVPIVKPRQSGPQVLMGACPDDDQRFCNSTWPTDVLGPKPKFQGTPPSPKTSDLVPVATCGTTCRSNEGCGSSAEFDSGCRCVVPKTLPIYESIDPVFPTKPTLPFGRCMSLTKQVLGGFTLASLGGRDLESEQHAGWECHCNATYTSPECCDSHSGMIR